MKLYQPHFVLLISSFFMMLNLTPFANAETSTDPFHIGGSARVRTEYKDDVMGDYTSSIGSRFRIDLSFQPKENVLIFFQPQFSKIWGKTEYVPSGAAVNTETNTSGNTYDTGLDVHQAYIKYNVNDPLSVTLGRKEISLGDELLIGSVGWSHTGRSFDSAMVDYSLSYGLLSAIFSSVKDTNTASPGPGEKKISGVYSSNKVSEKIQNLDLYALYVSDSTVSPTAHTSAYGLRVKSPIEKFDYRGEYTFENVKSTTSDSDEHQLDIELGYLVHSASKSRVSAEYFAASENYDQLFPTGHKWLGYADLFGRRNIKGYRLGGSTQLAENFKCSLDYHSFQRVDSASSAYKLNGTTGYGTSGSSSDIGSEIDLTLSYRLKSDVTVDGGAAHIDAGDYMKDNGSKNTGYFYYLQVATLF